MNDQELKFFQDLQEEDSICRSMLHLSTAADHHPFAPAAPHTTTAESLEKYTATHGNSTKRQSPLSPFQEPASKRATLHPPSSPAAAASPADYRLLGFTKLSLPQSFPAASPPLRRTVSEPIYPLDTVNSAVPPSQLPEFPTSPGPILNHPLEETSNRNVVQESFPFSKTAPLLPRTVSDPSPASNLVMAASGTPPRPPAVRNASRSPSCGESPSTKRLKRMRKRLREMSQWWNQVVSEDDDEGDSEHENFCNENDHKEECENHMENPSQEAVWVEKNGECLVLHFRCPCGNGYQILLSGKNCYYKLTNF